MPVIHTHVSVPTTAEQRDALKTAFGQAIPAAYVEVNVFGSSVPKSAWQKLTPAIMDALQDTLQIPADRTYIRYTATPDWGWNGGNF